MEFFKKEELNSMLDSALSLLKNEQFERFGISTKIPKQWLTDEETEFDKGVLKSESVKNFANRIVVGVLAKNSGKKYDSNNPDLRVVFDFERKSVEIEHEALFIFGRYKKLVPEISQSRWLCKKCEGAGCFKCDYEGKNYVSVEELIGEPLKEETNSKNYSLHASGREDVDVVNTAGRPFVFELVEPKKRNISLGEMQEKINKDGKIAVSDLTLVRRPFVEVVTESHFDKEYEAEVEASNGFDPDALKPIIESISGKVIEQRTPNRVAHRRADLVRRRKILALKVLDMKPSEKLFKISVLAEAGTYIKELVTGDKGRTKPSLSDLIGPSKCKSLKVVKIHDDFLKMLIC